MVPTRGTSLARQTNRHPRLKGWRCCVHKEIAMRLVRWDPFRELESLSTRLNQVFGQPLVRSGEEDAVFADWAPAMDVEETEGEYVMKADLPDVKREDVKIGIEGGVLTVEGERKQEKEEKNKKFHRVERVYGKFVRRLTVPSDADQEKTRAEFKNGVLIVHLPKSAVAKPKQIDVKVA
jgi:HSP20 family protein